MSGLRWTVDELVDFEVVSNVFANFAPEIHFSWEQVLQLQNHPELFAANQNIVRNEGALMGRAKMETCEAGDSWWQHATFKARRNVSARAMAGVFQ